MRQGRLLWREMQTLLLPLDCKTLSRISAGMVVRPLASTPDTPEPAYTTNADTVRNTPLKKGAE
jgi:hypothetical protein